MQAYLEEQYVARCVNTQKGTMTLGCGGANNTRRGGATMYASFCGAHGGAREIEPNRRRQLIVQLSDSDFEVRACSISAQGGDI